MKKQRYIVPLLVCTAMMLSCASDSDPLFTLLPQDHTGISFENTIKEDSTFNMYAFMNIYTGGGVAVGDVNNDGLDDIYLSGNRVSSKLYLNKGNLQFEDVTERANLLSDRWCSGASMVDINGDGHLDIYVSVTGIGDNTQRSNLLYENQGNGKFEEKAEQYGLADARQIMHTSFFDYDRDGDLDAFMIVNPVNYALSNVNNVRPRQVNSESESTDRLYRNDGGVFIDVSQDAGISIEGYSLGVATADINGDYWPDIYVSNDFLTTDVLYINNQDGTFSDQTAEMLNHMSFAGMGNDVCDFDDDGHTDIMVVDMLPEDNLRRQTIIPASSYDKYQLTQKMGYVPQYTRNTLQKNNGDGTFSEIGQLAGIDKTDWSWASLFADYDNDGDKDLLITNGFLRDVGNLDYISYQRQQSSPFGKKEAQHAARLQAIQDLGAVKIPNYAYSQTGRWTFTKRTKAWGLDQSTCSNGLAYSDFDNDGDLDLIINNVNDRAFLYENNTEQLDSVKHLKISLKGVKPNIDAVGAYLCLTTSHNRKYHQHNLYRGYGSTVSQDIIFGLGTDEVAESCTITWPDGRTKSVSVRQGATKMTIAYEDGHDTPIHESPQLIDQFDAPVAPLNLEYDEEEYIDFKIQPLLPHKHSDLGPHISYGDINADSQEDFYIGGSASYSGHLYHSDQSMLQPSDDDFDKAYEDVGSEFFDADNDGDLDLYIVSGGAHLDDGDPLYQDRLYLNDGSGHFDRASNIPRITASGSCVVAGDFDGDGDQDLFVGGRIVKGAYPTPPQSYLLRNDTKGTEVSFSDISEILPNNGKIGMVTDAEWADISEGTEPELIIVGEWMPITIISFTISGTESITTTIKEVDNSSGWWNTIASSDFDGDGDLDFLAGNLGLNSRYKASADRPVALYAADFDKNGRIDPVMTQYIGQKNYVVHPRDLLIKQINGMRVRFPSYEKYGNTEFRNAFSDKEKEMATVLKATQLQSSYIENKGDGALQLHPMPIAAQTGPINSIQVKELNGDKFPDAILAGGSSSTEVSIGQYDAFYGGKLIGRGDGHFLFQKLDGSEPFSHPGNILQK